MGQLHEYDFETAAHIDCACEACEREAKEAVFYRRREARRELASVRQLIATDTQEELVFDYAATKRDEITTRLTALRAGKCPPMFAVAVRTTRHYGGPEEGGWWYDWTDIEEVRRAYTFRQLLRAVRELRAEHPTSRYGRYSCADTRGDVTIYMMRSEDLIEGLQSTERPRYE